MELLPVLFWIILVLCCIFPFVPATAWPYAPRAGSLAFGGGWYIQVNNGVINVRWSVAEMGWQP